MKIYFIFILILGCATSKTKEKSRVILSENLNTCQHTDTAFNCVKVTKIVDGDTLDINIPEMHPFFSNMRVRITLVDAPETQQRNGRKLYPCEKERALEAKRAVELLIKNNKRIDIVNIQKFDNNGRILATVLVDGISIADELLDQKLAVPYEERNNIKTWCI